MNELVKVIERDNVQMVNARDLHAALGVKTKFRYWIWNRVKDYGFIEGEDFYTQPGEVAVGRPEKDYFLTTSMAKELTVLHNGEIGKQIRRYLLQVEKAWNTPEAVIQRARAAGAIMLTEESMEAFEFLGEGMAITPFPGMPGGGIPESVMRVRTDNEAGGRVYIVKPKEKRRLRFVMIYGPAGEVLEHAGAMQNKLGFEELTPAIVEHLQRKYLDILGKWHGREEVSFTDYFRWKSSLIKQGINLKVPLHPMRNRGLGYTETARLDVPKDSIRLDAPKDNAKLDAPKDNTKKVIPLFNPRDHYIDDDDDTCEGMQF